MILMKKVSRIVVNTKNIATEKRSRNETMLERKYDQLLQIRTEGIREWRKEADRYNRYEATPYAALDALFRAYKLKPTDRVVDFGCGRGRVCFYIHNHFNVPVTGIENNDLTFTEALKNKAIYRQKYQNLTAPIRFEYGLAEQYPIQPEENVFYFFNPFSLDIFKQVVHNILQSVNQYPRTVDIIFYYPLPEYHEFLVSHTPFQLINKVKAYEKHGTYGKFHIYRLKEK